MIAATALLAGKAFAALDGYRITGSKHDFKSGTYTHSGQNMVSTGNCMKCHSLHGGSMLPENRCSMCHAAHKPKRLSPLWARSDPDSLGWVVWNGAAGQPLNGSQGPAYLTVEEFVASGSGLCLSCHDSGIAAALHDMSGHHPLGKIVPFGAIGWMTSLADGNAAAGSNVMTETRGTVGCTSCHSMHSSDPTDNKLRRPKNFCVACHDR